MERHLPADNAAPHFLTMMVRAPRAVDLLAEWYTPPGSYGMAVLGRTTPTSRPATFRTTGCK